MVLSADSVLPPTGPRPTQSPLKAQLTARAVPALAVSDSDCRDHL